MLVSRACVLCCSLFRALFVLFRSHSSLSRCVYSLVPSLHCRRSVWFTNYLLSLLLMFRGLTKLFFAPPFVEDGLCYSVADISLSRSVNCLLHLRFPNVLTVHLCLVYFFSLQCPDRPLLPLWLTLRSVCFFFLLISLSWY